MTYRFKGEKVKTTHHLYFNNSNNLYFIDDNSVDLVVTSPPYPMIEIWDNYFSESNNTIVEELNKGDGYSAFELMHNELDLVWEEICRVVSNSGIICINIGDATRRINDNFSLFPNSSRIINFFSKKGFNVLPPIIWRKQTNAPNKFMGSGMLPTNAYVTLEHEHILIFRKGNKREFKKDTEKINRKQSSYFWEERNIWFSNIWDDIKGVSQKQHRYIREISAEYPIEIPYRLINMFSVKGDIVLDPFVGTGTTTLAAMSTERNSIGVEIEPSFFYTINKRIKNCLPMLNTRIEKRINNHINFVTNKDGVLKYNNDYFNFPVTTPPEEKLCIKFIESIKNIDDFNFEVSYIDYQEYIRNSKYVKKIK